MSGKKRRRVAENRRQREQYSQHGKVLADNIPWNRDPLVVAELRRMERLGCDFLAWGMGCLLAVLLLAGCAPAVHESLLAWPAGMQDAWVSRCYRGPSGVPACRLYLCRGEVVPVCQRATFTGEEALER